MQQEHSRDYVNKKRIRNTTSQSRSWVIYFLPHQKLNYLFITSRWHQCEMFLTRKQNLLQKIHGLQNVLLNFFSTFYLTKMNDPELDFFSDKLLFKRISGSFLKMEAKQNGKVQNNNVRNIRGRHFLHHVRSNFRSV